MAISRLRARLNRTVAVVIGGGFLPVTGAALSSAIESNVVTLRNIGNGVPLTISGGSYSKNGAAYSNAATTVSDGDTLRLRVTSSGSNGTATTATATIDGKVRAFTVTTAAAVTPTPTPGPTPTPTPTPGYVLPAHVPGITGNHICYPSGHLRAGGGKVVALGAVLANGNQVVYAMDYAAGTAVVERTTNTSFQMDDHNIPSGSPFSDGAELWVSMGHNNNARVIIDYRAPDGTWSKLTTLVAGGNTTYPGVFVDKNDRVWLNYRISDTQYVMRYSDDRGQTFTEEFPYIINTRGTGSTKVYGLVRFNKAKHKFYGYAEYLSTDEVFGKGLKLFEFDCATMEFSHGGGALGRLGSASANGKVLPFDIEDLGDVTVPPSGRVVDIQNFDERGDRFAVYLINKSNLPDTQVEFWQCPTPEDRYNGASYTKTPLYNIGARLAYGSFNAPPGIVYDLTQPNRFYAARAVKFDYPSSHAPGGQAERWVFERWDGNAEGTVWTSTRITSGSTLYDNVVRPSIAFNGAADTPIWIQRTRDITEYDQITGARIEFINGGAGIAGVLPEPAMTQWLAQATITLSAAQRAIVNTGFRDLQVGGLLPDQAAIDAAIGQANLLLAGESPVSTNTTVNDLWMSMLAILVADTGYVVPDYLRQLNVAFNPAPKQGVETTITVTNRSAGSTITFTSPGGQVVDLSSGSGKWTPANVGVDLNYTIKQDKAGLTPASRTETKKVTINQNVAPFFVDNLSVSTAEVLAPGGHKTNTPADGEYIQKTVSGTSGQIFIAPNGKTYCTGQQRRVAIPATPPTANYRVEGKIRRDSDSVQNSLRVMLRATPGVNDDGYAMLYSANDKGFRLERRNAGTNTLTSTFAYNIPVAHVVSWAFQVRDVPTSDTDPTPCPELTLEVNGAVALQFKDTSASKQMQVGSVDLWHVAATSAANTGIGFVGPITATQIS